ncbi:hypothetical protein quinque_001245 [Culex quinquefasciatus]
MHHKDVPPARGKRDTLPLALWIASQRSQHQPGQPGKKPKQGGGASVVAMLCFNLKIATIFRTYRPEATDPVRDRSQSLFTPPPRAPHRDIGALRGLQRRASSVM